MEEIDLEIFSFSVIRNIFIVQSITGWFCLLKERITWCSEVLRPLHNDNPSFNYNFVF